MKNNFVRAFEEILDVEPGSLSGDADFKSHPEWDSLAALSVITMIEDVYKKVIDPSVLKTSKTIEELRLKVEEH